eukprot:4588181-Amphidinium_carterae.1
MSAWKHGSQARSLSLTKSGYVQHSSSAARSIQHQRGVLLRVLVGALCRQHTALRRHSATVQVNSCGSEQKFRGRHAWHGFNASDVLSAIKTAVVMSLERKHKVFFSCFGCKVDAICSWAHGQERCYYVPEPSLRPCKGGGLVSAMALSLVAVVVAFLQSLGTAVGRMLGPVVAQAAPCGVVHVILAGATELRRAATAPATVESRLVGP